MATSSSSDTPESPTTGSTSPDATTPSTPEASPKKKTAYQYPIHPAQYRAVRMASFLLEDTKHEITPPDFLREAIARHLDYYQTKRNVEFPPKMLEELTRLHLIS